MGIKSEALLYSDKFTPGGTTCDVKLSQITLFIHGKTLQGFKILQNCTFLLFFSLSIPIQICITQTLWSLEVKCAYVIKLHF